MALDSKLSESIQNGEQVAFMGKGAREYVPTFFRHFLHEDKYPRIVATCPDLEDAVSEAKYPFVIEGEALHYNHKVPTVAIVFEDKLIGIRRKLTNFGG